MHSIPQHKKIKNKLFLLLGVVYSSLAYSQKNDDIYYSFTQTDTTYSFFGRVKINADANCAMNICFNYTHIKALALDANNVELIEEGADYNKIKYTYELRPMFRNESWWSRTIDRKNQKVSFTLMFTINNSFLMPRMKYSSGYYKINQTNEGTWVEYFQYSKLTKSKLTSLYLNLLQKKAVDFLRLLQAYSQKHCNNTHATL